MVPNFDLSTKWNFDGRKKYQSAELGLNLETQGQVNISTSYQAGSETFRNIEFDDIWLLSLGASKTFSEKLFVRALADYGRQISRLHLLPGKQTSINLYAYIRPNDRLQIEPDYDYIKSIHAEENSTLYEGYIFWTRIYYHFNREFNIRLIVQYDDLYETLNVDPLITYRINPFTVFYLGTTYEYCKWISSENGYDEKNTYLNKRQFFVKLQYMFRF